MPVADHDKEFYAFHHADNIGELTEKLNHNIRVLAEHIGFPTTHETLAQRHGRIAAKLALVPRVPVVSDSERIAKLEALIAQMAGAAKSDTKTIETTPEKYELTDNYQRLQEMQKRNAELEQYKAMQELREKRDAELQNKAVEQTIPAPLIGFQHSSPPEHPAQD